MKTITLFFLLIYISFVCGCQKDSPANLMIHSPKCKIIEKSGIIFNSKYPWSKMGISVENYGEGPTAFNINCYVKLKNGNLVVDESSIYLGTLKQSEIKKDSLTFVKLKNPTEFSTMEIILSWEDVESKVYSENQ